MEVKKYYATCESMGQTKHYIVEAYSEYAAEKEALHKFRAECPMLAFYAMVKSVSPVD